MDLLHIQKRNRVFYFFLFVSIRYKCMIYMFYNNISMNIKQQFNTRNKSSGKNTCEYVVLHHTATGEGTIKWVINQLTVGPVSCHYIVDTNGDIYKIWNDTDILWHAGVSSWKWKSDMNKYSIGIEIIGPLKDGWFTDAQLRAVEELVFELCYLHNLTKDKVIRHKDIAPKRKTDVADTLWNKKFDTYSDWIDSIFFIQPLMKDFSQALKDEQSKTPGVALITKFEGEEPLSEKATRELLEIGLLRLYRTIEARILKK